MARKKKESDRVDEMLDELLADCQTPRGYSGRDWFTQTIEQTAD